MKKAISVLVAGLLLFSCKTDVEESESTVSDSRPAADSTLATFEADAYSAELKVRSSRSTGAADGPALWQRSGPMSYILNELYRNPVELRNSPDSRQHYQLEIRWEEQVTLDDIRPDVTERLQEELGYSVTTETRPQQRYILSVPNPARLDTTAEEGFVEPGSVSKVSMGAERWQIYAPLGELASVLSEQTDRTVVMDKEYGSRSYYIELTHTGGFDEITRQLEQAYGMTVQEERVQVAYHTMMFH